MRQVTPPLDSEKNGPASPGRYAIDQCALYKLRSKGRLASVLGVELPRLRELAKRPDNYKVFPLKRTVCEFTGKVRKERRVQEPKTELRAVHGRLRDLLARVEPPPYAHGAIVGRSYRSNAAAHVTSGRAATFDIRSFYPSTSSNRVFSFFHAHLHCSSDVATLLTALTCADGGLPTGSPLSPLLSLYANMPMFDALGILAGRHGLTFTCYIDDLAFSGASIAPHLPDLVRQIVENHGHHLAKDKTKIFGRRNAKHITGVALKDGRVTVPHSRFLKARAVLAAIATATGPRRIELQRRLAGMLAEASHLDSRFQGWSKIAHEDLRRMKRAEVSAAVQAVL